MIWGMTLEPGKLYTEVIGDEVHLSMASLESRKDFATEAEQPEGTCHIIMKTEKSEYLLCTLANRVIYQQSLDLKLMPREKVTFSVQGSNMVYLTGYSTSYPDMEDHYEGESETGEWEPYDTGGDISLDNSTDVNESAALNEEEESQGEISVKGEAEDDASLGGKLGVDQQEQLPMETPDMVDQPPTQPKQEPGEGSDQHEMIFSIAELEANVKQEPQEPQDDITIIPEDDDDGDDEQRLQQGEQHAQQQQLHEHQQLQELQSQLQQHSNQLQQQQQSNQYIQQQAAMMQQLAPVRTRGFPQVRRRGKGRTVGRQRPRLPQSTGAQQTYQQNLPSGSSHPPMTSVQGPPHMPVAGFQGNPAQQNVAQAPMQQHQDQAMINQPGSSRQDVPGPSTSRNGDSLPPFFPMARAPHRRQQPEGISLEESRCPICGKLFQSAGNCKRHQLIHTGQKPFGCKFCDRSFNQKSSLKTHERLHTGHRPYACSYCGIHFIRSEMKISHEKSCKFKPM